MDKIVNYDPITLWRVKTSKAFYYVLNNKKLLFVSILRKNKNTFHLREIRDLDQKEIDTIWKIRGIFLLEDYFHKIALEKYRFRIYDKNPIQAKFSDDDFKPYNKPISLHIQDAFILNDDEIYCTPLNFWHTGTRKYFYYVMQNMQVLALSIYRSHDNKFLLESVKEMEGLKFEETYLFSGIWRFEEYFNYIENLEEYRNHQNMDRILIISKFGYNDYYPDGLVD